ncbi:ABC transporter substrate-binding protein [Croceitalea rosinachiae]|uniref:ABC transporter substrate-binding protein n=1 Tax=Croceitalea rosinachiae TaxID=3075596 RepID=A0ABU3AE91_9FLAO|nr:ABC transporter substrate-binding protein [Croceitalea sp. F388]MDT0607201.1 ABC transporter substrate-binding protein [Croceitalea sp. F388]
MILFNLSTKVKYPIFETMEKMLLKAVRFCLILMTVASCKKESKSTNTVVEQNDELVQYAVGFDIDKSGDFPVIHVTNPWPNAKQRFTYAFIPKDRLSKITFQKEAYDAVISTPIQNLVVTSTTHIPALESLGGLNKLIGFPDIRYISSMPARQLINSGKIKELGSNQSLNTEMVLEMSPDAVVGFAIDNQNSTYEVLQKSGIPILYNGDWTEQTPLGKAEWIKFFGVLLGKEKEADSIFKTIASSYNQVKELARTAKKRPTVLSGALYKDVWYLPAGKSWAAQFLADANADYLWADSEGTGSLSLSLETALEKGQDAEFWISPSQFTTYDDLINANNHYSEFEAFKNKHLFTFSATKGPTGGLLYYELAPQRPDLVLKDLVHIFHPEVLPNHVLYFFTPLK